MFSKGESENPRCYVSLQISQRLHIPQDLQNHVGSVWLSPGTRLWKGRSAAAANPSVSMDELSLLSIFTQRSLIAIDTLIN